MTLTTVKSIYTINRDVYLETGAETTEALNAAVCERLTDAEKLEFFQQANARVASTVLSDNAIDTGPNSFLLATDEVESMIDPPQEGFTSKKTGIKKAGKPWSHGLDTKMLRTGFGRDLPKVKWPEFSLDMVEARIAARGKAIQTMTSNQKKDLLIRDTLNEHGVKKIKQLKPAVKKELEKQLGSLPDD